MRRALLFALAVLALPLQAADLKPFSASYTADWKQLPMSGTAERSLTKEANGCLLYTSPSPRDGLLSRMPSSA